MENKLLPPLSNGLESTSVKTSWTPELKWKRDFLSNVGAAFDRKDEYEELEKDWNRLYKKAGNLKMEKDFLKKNLIMLGL